MGEHSPKEFLPLAFYPWISRWETLPIKYDEAATALYLGKGDVSSVAALLRVGPARCSCFFPTFNLAGRDEIRGRVVIV